MNRIYELEEQIKKLKEENGQLKAKIAKLEDDKSRCSGCGDYLSGPHFCDDDGFGF